MKMLLLIVTEFLRVSFARACVGDFDEGYLHLDGNGQC